MKNYRIIVVTILAGLSMFPASRLWSQTAPSQSERSSYSGLFASALSGDVAQIRILVSQGADPNERDSRGRTPIQVAAYYGRHGAMQAIMESGGDPNAMDIQRYDIVTITAVADDLETLKIALSIGGDPTNITSPYDGTALIAAAHLGHEDVVKTLSEAGAPLDHINNLGWTALIEAIILGDGGTRHTTTVTYLLAAGASPNIPDRNGQTPLQLAETRGYNNIVALLKHYGALSR
jgi:ankyrin repeat protein